LRVENWVFLTGGPALWSSPAIVDGVVYVESGDGKVYAIGTPTTPPAHWEPLGGYLTASPAAVSFGSGFIDVAARSTDGAVWQKQYENGWWMWTSRGDQRAPTAASGLRLCRDEARPLRHRHGQPALALAVVLHLFV
jgi:outer membrane protein assembly factor BamB